MHEQRVRARPDDKNYLGNKNTKELHDLRNEQPECDIDVLLATGLALTFEPDTLEYAQRLGYSACEYCSGGEAG